MIRKVLAIVLAVVIGATAATIVYASKSHSDLDDLKHATTKFHSLGQAKRAGYGLLTDAEGITCIDMPDMGAMGVHYANGALVADGAIDPLKPEAIVYAPDGHGNLHLAAVEYVVFKAAWDATHDSVPSLFGQPFATTDSPNRYGLDPFYSLHVWVWQKNPVDTFAMWNPDVHCPTVATNEGPRKAR